MSIDEKMKKLQEIADKLEKNEVTFEESLKLFEEVFLLFYRKKDANIYFDYSYYFSNLYNYFCFVATL